ncbi:LADA_0B06700g1_1 [Lachancea dasiensis]|uniref:Origin recognition complex subunit 2 n=1 Tax=Lachancea dasiensis TaxID=1072105 RepID=A0A1G4ITM1_9SACH|nr:LADA_0B06700g1_1 [Lachancea dasiensis]
MSESEDIVWHQDFAASGSGTPSSSSMLPSFWRFLNRRIKGTGRAGSTSPAKRKIDGRDDTKLKGQRNLFGDLQIADREVEAGPQSQKGKDEEFFDSSSSSSDVDSSIGGVSSDASSKEGPRKRSRKSKKSSPIPPTKRQHVVRSKSLSKSPKRVKSEGLPDAGFVTADSSPIKARVFASPAKSPSKPILNKSPFKITLNRNFVPSPLPYEGEYQPPQEKHLTYFFDGFEGYIDQKKPIRAHKKSTNSMGMAPSVTREEFSLLSNTLNSWLHKDCKNSLQTIQRTMFPQYWFEVDQGFSLLFYGIGSKRKFLEEFVIDYLSPQLALSTELNYGSNNEVFGSEAGVASDDESMVDGVPCVVINGYNPTCNYRDVFQSITQIMLKEELSKSETKYWSNHVELQINKMDEVYRHSAPTIKLIVLVHNLDGPMVRKDAFQNMLSSLARIRQIAIVASSDHIYAPLLWDHVRAQNFNFVFHDITNYESYAVESSFNDVMKLGKSQSSTGAEGARYVLESLTVNSKRMYKLLIETQLSAMEHSQTKVPANKRGSHAYGIEFKQFYHMCAAEFIASNEVSLRSMLGEFIEHKMAALSKNRGGAETLYVPYVYSEMQTLLKDVLDV